jgi:hypothetical protein
MRDKAVCDYHGGKSTEPKTEAGKPRLALSCHKTGEFTTQAMEDRESSMRMLHGLGHTI